MDILPQTIRHRGANRIILRLLRQQKLFVYVSPKRLSRKTHESCKSQRVFLPVQQPFNIRNNQELFTKLDHAREKNNGSATSSHCNRQIYIRNEMDSANKEVQKRRQHKTLYYSFRQYQVGTISSLGLFRTDEKYHLSIQTSN